VAGLSEVGWGFSDDDFEGGPDLGGEEVASAGGSVGEADNDVGVYLRSVVSLGDVADEGEELRDRLPG
jgi:hypothetical protein